MCGYDLRYDPAHITLSGVRGQRVRGVYPSLQDADIQSKVCELPCSHEATDPAPYHHHLEWHLPVHWILTREHPVVDEAIPLQVTMDTQH